MHPGQPRDVDLKHWLRGVSFHPANTRLKQLGHAIVRQAVANLGSLLAAILPPGEDKTVAFRHLTDLMMYATRALAVNGGPRPILSANPDEEVGYLDRMNDSLIQEGSVFGAVLEQDPRISQYEAQQRGETFPEGADPAVVKAVDDFLDSPAPGPLDALPFPVPEAVREQAARDPFANRPPLGRNSDAPLG